MHSPTHSPARDPDAWTPETKPAKKPRKSAKKPAKKTSTAKKKSSAKKKSTAKKKSSAKLDASVFALVERLKNSDPETLQAVVDALLSPDTRPAAGTTIAALRREIAGLEREVTDFRRQLAELSTAVTDLAARDVLHLAPGEPLVDDPFLRWLQDPSIEQHRGRHVAIHATRGVVAHGDSLREVMASVDAQGLAPDDVCLATVPAAPF